MGKALTGELSYMMLLSQLIPLSLYFSFDGRVVAKLPFVPISLLQGISHRNLAGEDYTDCSFIFLYILCTMSIRQVYVINYMCCIILSFKKKIYHMTSLLFSG